MFESIQKGLLTEIDCQRDFSYYGILLSQPLINDSRYDFVADIDGKFYRIQCKTCTVNEDGNAISFKAYSVNAFSNQRYSYEGQIDYFYTSYNGQGFLIPISDIPGKSFTIRFICGDENANNTNVHWAEKYKFDTVIKQLTENIQIPIQAVRLKGKKTSSKCCIDCGVQISRQATRCEKCNVLFVKERNKEKGLPSTKLSGREELKNLIRNNTFASIGRKFGCSDHAVRKWCDKYNLPRTKKDIEKYTDIEWEEV